MTKNKKQEKNEQVATSWEKNTANADWKFPLAAAGDAH